MFSTDKAVNGNAYLSGFHLHHFTEERAVKIHDRDR